MTFDVSYWSGLATIAGLFVGIGALIYAGAQLSLARKAASATALIALNESFRQNWQIFMTKKDTYAFADLLNVSEIACAIYRDKIFYGQSKQTLQAYLIEVFALIDATPTARDKLVSLLGYRETFNNIGHFLAEHRAQIARAVRIRKQQEQEAKADDVGPT